MNRTILGTRGGGGPEVTVDGRPLPLRLDHCRHHHPEFPALGTDSLAPFPVVVSGS